MDDWLATLSEASAFTGAEGATSEEIAEAVGQSVKWVRAHLLKLDQQGRLVIAKAKRKCLGGVTTKQVYRLLPAAKKR